MSKSMLINVILEEESRVAIVDNGVLDFFEIETLTKGTLKGNIYKATVENVNGALDAAFVNCGWDRPGFLPLDEVNFRVLPSIKGRKSGSRIQEHIVPGMEILVQVIRDKFNNKPPSLTTYYSLPGRYLVLTPYSDASGVSRKIEDEKERGKLKNLIEDLNPPEKYGVIVRTAGIDQSRHELVRDLGYLMQLWETIERASSAAPPPSLIYRERGLALRTIRDHLTDDIEEVLIDDQEVYESALRFIRAVAPQQEPKIKLYAGDKPLFTRFNLEDQIETIYKRRVPLKSGGEIVIEGTEAMTTVDVNSSKSREANVEDLALRTNLEASAEIGRQLRLRDIGGLIVVDFIDMEAPKHLRAVEKVLLESMRRDKAKFDATKISKLGMLEISRQRLKAAKSAATYETCKACDGAGSVRTTEAAAIAALRRIQTRVVRGDIGALSVTAPTDVALYLLNQQRDELLALERRYDVRISLIPRPDFPKERCELETTAREGPPAQPHRDDSRRREMREFRPPAESPSLFAPQTHSIDEPEKAEPAASAGAGRALPSAAARDTAGDEPAMAQAPEARSAWEEHQDPAASQDLVAHQSHLGRTDTESSGDSAAVGDPASGADLAHSKPPFASSKTSARDGTISGRESVTIKAPAASGTLAAGPAGTAVTADPADPTDPTDDDEFEGTVVWEDIEESGAPVPASSGTPVVPGKLGANPETEQAGPERKKRRRKRGGKGRNKKGTDQVAGSETKKVPTAASGRAAAGRSVLGGSGRGSAPPRSAGESPRPRRKRKRGPDTEAGGAARVKFAEARPPLGAASTGRIPSTRSGPAAAPPRPAGASQVQDEEVPGGWWSRLVAPPKKRGDREDE